MKTQEGLRVRCVSLKRNLWDLRPSFKYDATFVAITGDPIHPSKGTVVFTDCAEESFDVGREYFIKVERVREGEA